MTNSYVQVPPDSTGKKLHALQHTVGANTVQVQGFHVVDSVTPTNALTIDQRGAASIRFSEGQPTLSGFGSLNVSQKRALGVYESSSGSYDDLFSVDVVTGGTSTYDDFGHSNVSTVTSASLASVVRTTNRYHYYLPGSSNLVIQTIACGDTGKANNQRRWGAFDSEDGVFWELQGTTFNVVIRSSTTGSVVESKVAKAAWNGDRLDGTGLSGMTLNITNINLYWIDYQWLGAGRVRFGVFTPDGSRVVCHTFQNAGQNALPYMRSGTLPLRTENTNTSATGAGSDLREVCMAIYTEGTYEDYTFWRSSDMDSTVTVGSTNINVLALRSLVNPVGLNHHNSIIAYPETLNIYCDQPVRIDLRQDVTVSGGLWNVGAGESSIEGSADTTVTDFTTPFKTWFFAAGTHTVDLTKHFEVNDEGIMLRADGTASIWAFTGKRLSGTNSIVTLNLGYRELW